MFIFLFFSVRLLHLSLWTATQKTLHISLPGDPGQIDQEVTEVDSNAGKVEKILKDSLDSIPSPSPSVKIQIMGGKVCLRCKGKTLLGIANKLLKTKCLLTSPINVLPYYLK